MRKRFNWLTGFLSSPRLAMMLILCTGLVITIGVIVGGKGWFGREGPATLLSVLTAFLFLNTLLCTWRQIRRRIKVVKHWRELPRTLFPKERVELALSFMSGEGRVSSVGSIPLGKVLQPKRTAFEEDEVLQGIYPGYPSFVALESLRAALIRRRYKVVADYKELSLGAWKSGWGHWGSIVFHIGLLIVILGGFFTLAFQFDARFGVIQGSTFTAGRDEYVDVNSGVFAREPMGFSVYLKKIEVEIDDERTNVEADVVFLEKGQPVKEVRLTPKEPVRYRNINFYHQIFGYAPAFIIRDPDGNEVARVRSALDTVLHKDGENYQGGFKLTSTPYSFWIEFFPELGGTGQSPKMLSYKPVRPGVYLKVYRQESNSRIPAFTGTILAGDRISLVDGNTLEFHHLDYWEGISVNSDPGVAVVYFGFGVAVAGLSLMFLMVPRRVVARVMEADGGMDLAINAKGRYHSLVEEELRVMVQEVKASLDACKAFSGDQKALC